MFDTTNSFPNWPYLAIIGSNVFMFALLTYKQMDAQINKTVIFSDLYIQNINMIHSKPIFLTGFCHQ